MEEEKLMAGPPEDFIGRVVGGFSRVGS